MRLTIIGAGAIGGSIGAHLIRDGHEVLFCDADPAHVAAINTHGLTIEGPVENFTVAARAVTPDRLPDTIEHAAVAVRRHHTAQAAALLPDRLGPDGYVVSFQNGLTADTLSQAVGRDRLIMSFVNFGADVVAPGRILQEDVGAFLVGEPDGGRISSRVQELAKALPYAVATDNIKGFLWGNGAYRAMLYAGAVSDLSIAEFLEDPAWRPLMLAVAREVLTQAPVQPEGFDGFDPEDLEGSLDRLVAFNRASAESHSGIYRDLIVRHRETEGVDLLQNFDGPLTTHIGELIHAIERGERTCQVSNLELLTTYERTERLGRPLSAVVTILSAPSRAPAGPLLGVAVAVKDLIDVAGVPRGNGNPHDMVAAPARADAPIVAALRMAGADVFATTSLLEYAAGATHPDLPETRNPYDLKSTAGGSSGGSAALVGVGACRVALGTDTGGSIRIPAHYCAVVGLKPSFGVLDVVGVQPLAPSLDHVGLIGKDVQTVANVFTALTGGHVPQPSRSLRIGIIADQLDSPALHAEVARVLKQAVDELRRAGCTVLEVDGAVFEELDHTFDDILMWEAWRVHAARIRDHPGQYGPETLRLLLSASKTSEASYKAACARRDELLPQAKAAYEGVDLLLTPAAPFVAPSTTPPADTPEGEAEGMFTRVYNLTGAPAIVIPCGWNKDLLPIGVQLSAPRDADLWLLGAAARIEEILAIPRHAPAIR